ncbi:MAG: hypothetical protein MRJ96_01775 [Nitrospirales bacterium]|nr:hypothetical protein [Nitrospira sp.]MDR4500173.1 hypothetical protein [Nitrospirales bacterium]
MSSTQNKTPQSIARDACIHSASKWLMVCALLLIGAAGCKNNNSVLQTWVGKSESELIANWGNPDLRNTFANGEKIYTWIDQGKNQYGPFTCQKSMTINHNHTITKGISRGCPSLSLIASSSKQ